MTFKLRVYCKGGYPNNFPYVFHMDNEDWNPLELFTFKAKNKEHAIELLQTKPHTLRLPKGFLEHYLFERFIVEELA